MYNDSLLLGRTPSILFGISSKSSGLLTYSLSLRPAKRLHSQSNYLSARTKIAKAVTLQVQALMSMNPRRLPRHHRHLLLKQDFARLGSGSTIHKQFWLAEVESALAEAAIIRHIKKKKYKSVLVKWIQKRKVVYRSSIISSFEPPATVSEKGLKWKKRHQK
jgi:hypothetical protein